MAMTGYTAKLVKTGYPNYGTETSFPLRLYVCYKVTNRDTVNAITTLSLGMYFTVPSAWYVGPWTDDYGSYIGIESNTFTAGVPSNFSGTLWLVENKTMNVQHDAQGKGTAVIKWKWGVNSSYGQMEKPSGSFSVTLEDIPRASSVSVGGAAAAGLSLAISVKRAVNTFTHTLRYAFGSKSGTIAEGVDTSYAWEIPYDLLKEFPAATSGVGTIYCDTYNGNTLLGTSNCNFTVTAPLNDITRPSLTMTLSPVTELSGALAGVYVKGYTKVQADFEASSEYSTIRSYALTVNGKNYSGNPAVSDILGTTGDVPVTGTVTDARGFTRSVNDAIPVLSYEAPRVVPAAGHNSIVCARGLSNGVEDPSGLHLIIKAARKYSSLTVNGEQQNFCVLRFRYKQTNADAYSEWVTLIEAEDLAANEVNVTLPNIVDSATTSYNVEIGVLDTMGLSSSVVIHVPTDEVGLHIKPGGKGAAFFGYSEEDGELTVNGDLRVNGNVYIGMNLFGELLYPVGSIYMSAVETEPFELFGFGTWERIEDVFLLAAGSAYEAGSTGGEESHVLTAGELPRLSGTVNFRHWGSGSPYTGASGIISSNGEITETANGFSSSNTEDGYRQLKIAFGGGQAHNNMPPYRAVYAWQRTA